jgi:hypothetical protein
MVGLSLFWVIWEMFKAVRDCLHLVLAGGGNSLMVDPASIYPEVGEMKPVQGCHSKKQKQDH